MLAAAVVLGLGPFVALAAPARGGTAFSATALAYGEDSAVSGTSLPLGASAQADTPMAQAVYDSLPTSKGYAATLYPGDFVASAPGLVAGATKQPVPPYPLIVSSDAATAPNAGNNGPGFSMSAKSDEKGTRAVASQGSSTEPTQLGYAAAEAASKRADDGGVRADAASTLSGFSVGTTLAFATVTTTATAAVDAAGHVTTRSGIEVSGVTVNGQKLGFADGRLVTPGHDQPLPADPIHDALAKAGISVTYLAEQKLTNGIASPAIQVTITEQGPPGTPADGAYSSTYTLGRALTTIESSAAPPAPAAAPVAATPSAPALPAGPATAPGAATDVGVGPTGATAASAAARSLSRAAPVSLARRGLVRPPHLFDAEAMYLVLAMAAALLAACTQLVRHLGVRTTWNS